MLFAEKLLQEDFRKLFLALTLVKSKPLNISVKEFLRVLRNNLKRRNIFQLDDSEQCLDAVAYWKDKYSALMDDNVALKTHILALQHQGNPSRPESPPERSTLRVANTPMKRKRDSRWTRSNSQDASRLMTIADSPKEEDILEHSRNVPGDVSSAKVTEYLGHVYDLQWTLKQKTSTPIDIGGMIIDLCVDLMGLVESRNLHFQQGKPDKGKTSKAVENSAQDNINRYRLLKRGCSDLMSCLRLYASSERKASADGRVVYAVARLFATVLERIQRISSSFGIDNLKPIANQGRGRLKGRKISVQIGSPEDGLRSSLSHILVWMLAQLDLSCSLQKDIMDACMHYLLSRVGLVLKKLVFQPEAINSSVTNDENADSLRSEAPYLAWVCERALTAYRNFHLPPKSKLSQKSLSSMQKGVVSMALSDAARTRLQKTMLKVVYDDDNISFEDRLLEPKDSEFDFGQCAESEADNIDEWFTSKVWSILGWDMLQDYIKFDGA